MNIVVDNLMTNYRLTGKGRLVVLLHGWGDSIKGLNMLAEALSDRYKVLAVDLPGFGGTQAPDSAWDLDDYAKFLGSLLTKLGAGQPYALIGHSNGGALTIQAVGSGAVNADKLVLIAASGIRTGKGARRLLLNIVAKAGNIATIWMPERYRAALRKSLYGMAGSDLLVAPHLAATFKKTVRQDVQETAASIKLPALLIYGAVDHATPVAYGRRFHQLLENSELQVIDTAGHFVHQEQPDKVNKLIKDFLDA